MKYTRYPFIAESLVRQYRKSQGASKKLLAKSSFISDAINTYITEVAEYHNNDTYSLNEKENDRHNVKNLLAEIAWSESSRKIIFIESLELINELTSGVFTIPKPEVIKPFSECFIVHLPKPTEYLCEDVASLLVNISEYNSSPNDKYIEVYSSDSNRAKFRCDTFYKWSLINEILSTNGYKEYKNKYSSEFSKIEYQVLRLVAGLIVYASTSNEAIVPGFPEMGNIEERSLLAKSSVERYTLKRIHAGDNKTHKGEHYRSFHLRQLVDERYYQGQYSHLEPGSRIVTVKGAYIGGSVDPYRAVDKSASETSDAQQI